MFVVVVFVTVVRFCFLLLLFLVFYSSQAHTIRVAGSATIHHLGQIAPSRTKFL